MGNVKIAIPYGEKSISFSLARERLSGILKTKSPAPRDCKGLITRSLSRPLGDMNLDKAVCGKKSVLIVVPDMTRHAHLKELLPQVLKKIDRPSRKISVIVATGLHKKHTSLELKALLGAGIVKRYRVLCHDQSDAALMTLGKTSSGVPIVVNKELFAHDAVISIGVIEPHLYAGYSGGVKTVSIGLAGARVIDHTHGILFLDKPGTKIGSIVDNPFQEVLREIALEIPAFKFSINIVNDINGAPAKIFSGSTREVFEAGVAYGRLMFETEVRCQSDIVVCGIGHPKDINLYQASRAINYIVDVDRPIVRKGGVVIIAADLRDGIGTSRSEMLFYDHLCRMTSARDLVDRIKAKGCITGEHRAYMVARSMLDHTIVFVTRSRKISSRGPFKVFRTVDEALVYADLLTGMNSKVYIVPRSLTTIAVAAKSCLKY